MNVLFETSKLKIEYEFENAYLIDKLTGKEIISDNFYGEPLCGLINKNNEWAIIAGKHLTIWRAGFNDKLRIEDDKLKWIYDIRNKSDNIVEILTDPWNKYSAIWEFDTKSTKFKKLKDFRKYLDSGHKENVKW